MAIRKRTVKSKSIILASSSPRRMKILSDLRIAFLQRMSRISEIPKRNERPGSYALRLAREKALTVSRAYASGLILACDTLVVIDNTILGKPKNAPEAVQMLSRLSGKWHKVYSAIAMIDAESKRMLCGCSITKVKFKPMTDDDIAWYVHTLEPLDKAGSYGIQEIGMIFIEKIDGSFTGVAGLPVELFVTLLGRMGISIRSLIGRPP